MRNRKLFGVSLIGFLLPILLLLIVFYLLDFLPFGSKSLLIMDMDNQYVQFFAGLKDVVFGESSILYSWNMGFGANYLGLFAYYLSSPFSLVTLFFDTGNLPLGITVMTLLKIGMCGLTFSIFLSMKFKQIKWSSLLFSTAYALSSYVIGYSMCVMWLDSIIWLPILILALERLIDSKKTGLFISVLFLTFLSNYYTSFMVGGFCFLYFLYYTYTTKHKTVLKSFLRFVVCAAVAVGLSAFLILPTVFCMLNGKIGGANYSSAEIIQFNPLLLIPKLMAGNSYDTITYTGTPFVYAGLLMLLLFGVFLAAKTIAKREKTAASILIGLILLSFLVTKLDKIWHVFQTPNWFPFRYAFVLSFFVILCAYKAYLVIEEQTIIQFVIPVGILVLLISLVSAENKLINITLLCVYLLLCLALLLKKRVVKMVAVLLLLLVTSAELTWNATTIFKALDDDFQYQNGEVYTDFNVALTDTVQKIKADDSSFYRMEKTFERSKNDPMGLSMNGISHYSSAYDRNANRLLRSLGFAQDYFWCSYFGSTPITDSLFGVKYILSKDEIGGNYPEIQQKDNITVYQNPHALPIGGALASSALQSYQATVDPFYNQNQLMQALSGENTYFKQIKAQIGSYNLNYDTTNGYYHFTPKDEAISFIECSFTAQSNDPIYAYFPLYDDKKRCTMEVNGCYRGELFTSDTDRIQYLGQFEDGETVTVRIYLSEDELSVSDFLFYSLDIQAFSTAISKVQTNTFKTKQAKPTYIKGEITATDTYNTLFTSIRSDDGWQVYVDGKKQDYTAFEDTLICVPLTAGTHTIEFRFMPKGLIPGILISVLTLIGYMLYILFKNKAKQNEG